MSLTGNGARPVANGAHPDPITPQHSAMGNGYGKDPNGTANHSVATATATGVLSHPETQVYDLTEADIREMWNAPSPPISLPRLQPRSSHSLRQMTARPSRSPMWVTIALAATAAIITAAVITLIRGAEQDQNQLRATLMDAASLAAGSVNESLGTLQSLQEGGAFTPELVSSISALGTSSRNLVESAGALPTDGSSLAEMRLAATALAGRISRLGETFGATFSYRGQIAPYLMPPSLTEPLEITNLADNTALLAGWQSRLEQAAANPPTQPRLLRNHQALEATLPYLAVHLESYGDAVQNGRPEQASAALTQVASLLLAIGQDLDQAVSEITEIAEREIQSLTTDLQNLALGT
ncbi:MAG: hypothetical protein OXH26_00790 [bacterium]|nr:hypothetical protein [bacterium]